MIIRNNLASDPVRNHTSYLLGCITLMVIAVTFTLWNFLSLSGGFLETDRLENRIDEQQKQLDGLQQQSKDLLAKISRIKTPQFTREVEFLNDAIKRRVFSWTTLFHQLERTLPEEVRMVSVLPNIDENGIMLQMEVAGKSLNDVVKLLLTLQNSAIFSDVTFRSEHQANDGLLHANLSLRYLPEASQPAAVQAKESSPTAPAAEEDAQ